MAFDKIVPRSAIDEFDAMVQAGYQRHSRFRAAVTVNTGDADDSERLIEPGGCLSGIEFPSWSHVPHNEKEEKADSCAKVIVRLENRLVLEALASASIPSSVGFADIVVTRDTLIAAAQALIDQGAGPIRNEVCIACPYQWRSELRLDERINWIDGNLIKFRMDKTEFKWKIEFLSIYSANGSFDPAQGIGYAFTKESIDLTYSLEPTGDIGWNALELGWQLSGVMSAAAVVRLPKSIVEILGPKA